MYLCECASVFARTPTMGAGVGIGHLSLGRLTSVWRRRTALAVFAQAMRPITDVFLTCRSNMSQYELPCSLWYLCNMCWSVYIWATHVCFVQHTPDTLLMLRYSDTVSQSDKYLKVVSARNQNNLEGLQFGSLGIKCSDRNLIREGSTLWG